MKRIAAFSAAVIMLLLCGCAEKKERSLFAMDTVMTLSVYGKDAGSLTDGAEYIIKESEQKLSAENAADVARYNDGESDALSSEAKELAAAADEISARTNGAFDIHLRSVSELWGFGTENERVPSDEEISDALKQRNRIDFGGIAKGYTAARIREYLKEGGAQSAVVSLGGNVMLLGKKPDGGDWNVGIRHPIKTDSVIGTLKARDCAVVTSGGYERFFEKDGKTYHHILDPATGKPADSGIISATVVCGDDTLADAMSTALYVMGVDNAVRQWRTYRDFEMILVCKDTVYITDGLDFNLSDTDYKTEIIS